jgi:hypothetical protein
MMDQVMAISERSASSLHTVAGHAEYVYSVAEGATPPPWIGTYQAPGKDQRTNTPSIQ